MDNLEKLSTFTPTLVVLPLVLFLFFLLPLPRITILCQYLFKNIIKKYVKDNKLLKDSLILFLEFFSTLNTILLILELINTNIFPVDYAPYFSGIFKFTINILLWIPLGITIYIKGNTEAKIKQRKSNSLDRFFLLISLVYILLIILYLTRNIITH